MGHETAITGAVYYRIIEGLFMCCRYWMEESPELRGIVEEMNDSPLVRKWQKTSRITAYGEVRPTDIVPIIAPDKAGKRKVFPMKWGYSGKSLILNARVETAAEKPTFKDDWIRHRCIIPASWYFEWEHLRGNDGKTHTGDKYMIQTAESPMTWLCGLYRIEDSLPVFVVITREADESIRFIHDRMPLIMPKRAVDDWIDPARDPKGLLRYSVTKMIYEKI